MIVLPPDCTICKDFRDLIDFFNTLEIKMSYPESSGYVDQRAALSKAQQDLIMWGKI